MELAQDIFQMAFHRRRTDVQLSGDLFICLRETNAGENPSFRSGQIAEKNFSELSAVITDRACLAASLDGAGVFHFRVSIADDISTGAQNDLQRATVIARTMVAQFGMSERLGLVALENPHTSLLPLSIDRSPPDCSALAVLDQPLEPVADSPAVQPTNHRFKLASVEPNAVTAHTAIEHDAVK